MLNVHRPNHMPKEKKDELTPQFKNRERERERDLIASFQNGLSSISENLAFNIGKSLTGML